MSYGARRMKADSEELYRVLFTGESSVPADESRRWTMIYGPYSSLATAKGVATRNSRYVRPGNTLVVQKATTVWEDVAS